MTALPIPPHFEPSRVGDIWKVDYEGRAKDARAWAQNHAIPPAAADRLNLGLLLVDVQCTFCLPGFELYVGGRSGSGAVDDNRRLCHFIYHHLHRITRIILTMDTHRATQIFHAMFLVDRQGNHPEPYTLVSAADLRSDRWRFNPAVSLTLGVEPDYGQHLLQHYAAELDRSGKYDLTIWPYHAMLGGIGHALAPCVEEAVFFHSLARQSQPEFQIKGDQTFTESYSALGPEVTLGPQGESIGHKNDRLLELLLSFDALIIAGQAKSHCVAWTVQDLLTGIQARERNLASRIYLLDDCSSAVVVPEVVDYTEQAEAAYRRFAEAGMHVVASTTPLEQWPGPLGEAAA